jgi:hypothetical protein
MFKLSRGWRLALAAAAVTSGGVLLEDTGLYGYTLFIVIPMAVGAIASSCCRAKDGRAAAVGALAVVVASCSLLLFAQEGVICLVMALPVTAPMGALGGYMAGRDGSRIGSRGMAAMLLIPAGTMGWDLKVHPPLFTVRTSIEIAATPEKVWEHVVTFSDLPAPREWYFQAGLAYPIRARIEGSGPGAVRYCDFSTGPFVEPIKVWDAPRLLRFCVTENPAPMREWSPYGDVMPKHLHGYLVSRQGEFRLTALANGRTLLEGTTWYQHGLWPAQYWRWWSDAIIHRIHLRVLEHIRTLAQRE